MSLTPPDLLHACLYRRDFYDVGQYDVIHYILFLSLSLSLSLSLLNKFHAHNNRETLIDSGDTDRATRTPFKG